MKFGECDEEQNWAGDDHVAYHHFIVGGRVH